MEAGWLAIALVNMGGYLLLEWQAGGRQQRAGMLKMDKGCVLSTTWFFDSLEAGRKEKAGTSTGSDDASSYVIKPDE